ncbi:SPFH domain-containing protein [Brucella pituitosa]|uniref:Prohibitin family protein n=1 Tax=Brucella pituitosa TaxID=571256 RepID=A0A643EXI6_9HYPH|nr:prohibitin family protein [Brucella pituitosa]PQZ50640.1 Band 7 protein [Ochrobactrum sp. MYb19]PRA46682.1 Band 7 protein [Ochrobactrum sp. MYb68]PRA68680.1 Band 7 protein [Ochrobactrum sp. MYb18]PRA74093.1 Band 7 protein [Brucella thiophenivorans]PRA90932.1 Band 7 protein [Ochrobactrum sp. MYb14]PRA96382.1 Band 7 protein [Ochrobactrum sp. MYb15]
MRILAAIFGFFAFIITLTVVFGSWYTIDQGERGVLLRNGALVGTAQPGLGFKTPWIEEVVKVSVQSRAQLYKEVPAYSKDQQSAVLSLSVNYRIPADKVTEVYSVYGGEDGLLSRLVDRRVNEDLKTVFGKFTAVAAIQERSRLNLEVASAIQSSVKGPVIIDSVQIENIDFSDAYEASIEQRMLAEVEVQKLRQNAEREKVQAEITVTQAKANADAVRAKANAEAEAIRIKGDAEATSIKARGDALRENPGLVALTQAEKWNGQLPTTMLPGGSVPMLQLQ